MNHQESQSVDQTMIVPVRSLRPALHIYVREELGSELMRLRRHHATFGRRRDLREAASQRGAA